MFFSRRTTQAEYFDTERPPAELREFFRSLGRTNRLFRFTHPFERLLPQCLSPSETQQLTVLDLGAGDGSLGRALQDWAKQHGWDWQITNLDLCRAALELNPTGVNVAASVLALPFHDSSFDLVIASQMMHHLSDAEARQFLREAWRVSRRALFLTDLHRNFVLYSTLFSLFLVQRYPRPFRSDALLSVKRSWRIPEVKRIAREAGLEQIEVRLYFGARIILQAHK